MQKQLLEGYNRIIFRYIKDFIDQIDKTKEGVMINTIICGSIVIANTYLMSLTQQCCSFHAIANATKAISMYIDFIIQMNNIDTLPGTPMKLGTRDAAQFVYKKIFSTYDTNKQQSIMTNDESNDYIVNDQNIVLYVDNNELLQKLHQHNLLIKNMIYALFTEPIFYDEKSDTIEYYSFVIQRMLYINNIIESIQSGISLEKYKNIVEKQTLFKMLSQEKNDKVNEYINWLENEITS